MVADDGSKKRFCLGPRGILQMLCFPMEYTRSIAPNFKGTPNLRVYLGHIQGHSY